MNHKPSFTERVKQVVKSIPRGSVLSYAEVAEKAGNKKASRAVGTIMAKNFDPMIPCHRVITSSGALGHYNRGGTPAKKKLLESEGYITK